jgi:hypothetical protein
MSVAIPIGEWHDEPSMAQILNHITLTYETDAGARLRCTGTFLWEAERFF